jgi:hypothetical protein
LIEGTEFIEKICLLLWTVFWYLYYFISLIEPKELKLSFDTYILFSLEYLTFDDRCQEVRHISELACSIHIVSAIYEFKPVVLHTPVQQLDPLSLIQSLDQSLLFL